MSIDLHEERQTSIKDHSSSLFMTIYVVKTTIIIKVGQYKGDESTDDITCMKYISDNGQCPTECNPENCLACILNCVRTIGQAMCCTDLSLKPRFLCVLI